MMLNDDNGNLSTIRIGFMVSLVVGTILCAAGIAAAFMSAQGGETMIVSGAGLMSTSGFAKAIQKGHEK